MMRLTEHLTSLSQNYAEATEHPFLRTIADGTAPIELLSLWLSQDRIYAAHAYPRFIAHLITRVPFSSSDTIASASEIENQRLLTTLSSCLSGVVSEAQFFLRTAEKYGLDLDCWEEREETKHYVRTMLDVASKSSLQEGLVFLWAMEKVYLDAWTFVGRVMNEAAAPVVDRRVHVSSIQAPAGEFVTNWTKVEFRKFVQELADMVDALGIEYGSDMCRKAEEAWSIVVTLEIGFWPRAGEENLRKKYK